MLTNWVIIHQTQLARTGSFLSVARAKSLVAHTMFSMLGLMMLSYAGIYARSLSTVEIYQQAFYQQAESINKQNLSTAATYGV